MFQITQNRYYYFALSGVAILAGIIAMLVSLVITQQPFGIGVDFAGGARFEFQFSQPVAEDDLRDVLNQFGLSNPAVIELTGNELINAWQIRTEDVTPEMGQEITAAVGDQLVPLIPNTTQFERVSPSIGAEVTRAAWIAITVAAIIILIYIAIAFRQVPSPIRYGACAVSAMVHDLFIIFGFMAIMGLVAGWEIDALFVTAVLTIAGFSLQDTIVVFDRIRENIVNRPNEPYEVIVNRSILETIHRSLATQLAAMFVMVALILFGGASIRQFITVLFIGMLSGTYSSIFHAVPLLAEWEIRRPSEII
ncbi:MAG: preprotein translocase SecF subunit [Cellvibrionaceae bacterium]|jgi:preprotein translocase SecF subunit